MTKLMSIAQLQYSNCEWIYHQNKKYKYMHMYTYTRICSTTTYRFSRKRSFLRKLKFKGLPTFHEEHCSL